MKQEAALLSKEKARVEKDRQDAQRSNLPKLKNSSQLFIFV
jgi:hypothetical protein